MINVIGLGYIGLPTALMMASHGVEVIGTDYNKELVATLNAGKTTFKEDGLDELFQAAVKAGIRFRASICTSMGMLDEKPLRYISLVSSPSGSRKSMCCCLSGKVTSFVSIEGQ